MWIKNPPDPISHPPPPVPMFVRSFFETGKYFFSSDTYFHCWNLIPSCLFITYPTPLPPPTPFFLSSHLLWPTLYRLAAFLRTLFLYPARRVTAEEPSCPFPLVLPRLPQSHIFGLIYRRAECSCQRKILAYLVNLKAIPYSRVYCLYCNLIIMSNKCQWLTKWFSLA